MVLPSHSREEFIRFLADISSGIYSASDWESLVVTHYNDMALEEMRIQFVLASVSAGHWSPPVLPVSLRNSAKDLHSKLIGAGA
jgi:hypothetical protein